MRGGGGKRWLEVWTAFRTCKKKIPRERRNLNNYQPMKRDKMFEMELTHFLNLRNKTRKLFTVEPRDRGVGGGGRGGAPHIFKIIKS